MTCSARMCALSLSTSTVPVLIVVWVHLIRVVLEFLLTVFVVFIIVVVIVFTSTAPISIVVGVHLIRMVLEFRLAVVVVFLVVAAPADPAGNVVWAHLICMVIELFWLPALVPARGMVV